LQERSRGGWPRARTAAYRRAMTDRAGRAEIRRAWRNVAYLTRGQVISLSWKGKLHPDEQVRALAAAVAEAWFAEWTLVRSVAVACWFVALLVVESMLLGRVAVQVSAALIGLIALVLLSTGVSMARLRRVNRRAARDGQGGPGGGLEASGVVRPASNRPERCPCCGNLTLGERGGFDICPVCFWEDDGQDDPHADEVWGGPNGGLSLTEARTNYRRIGASDERALRHVRPPRPDEIPEP